MFNQTLIDTVAVLGLFVLRIGVPLALAIVAGAWLEKKLRLPDEQDTQRHEVSGKILQFRPRQTNVKPQTDNRTDEVNTPKVANSRK